LSKTGLHLEDHARVRAFGFDVLATARAFMEFTRFTSNWLRYGDHPRRHYTDP
jgi:hypothetical protein